MIEFEYITDKISLLKVPFESIYTAVFLVKTDDGAIIVDAAASQHDAENVILPALKKQIDPSDVKYIFCTHLHGDHGGGIRHLLPHLKNAKVAAASPRAEALYGSENVRLLRDGEDLCGIRVMSLAGHSADSMGLFDGRSGTILTGDGIQLCGIMRYGTGVDCPSLYIETLGKVRELGAKMLVASHEYYPLGSVAIGEDVCKYVDAAEREYCKIREFVKSNLHLGDAKSIAKAYTDAAKAKDPSMTVLQAYTVQAIINEKGM